MTYSTFTATIGRKGARIEKPLGSPLYVTAERKR